MPHKDLNKRKAYQKEYRHKHADKLRAYATDYYKENRETLRKRQREIYPKKKNQWNANRKKFRLENPKQIQLQKQTWISKNQDALKEKQRLRYARDLNYRLSLLLRNRLRKALKRNSKRGSAVRDLGCTIEQLKSWLENQFTLEMTWENMGTYWHIDHVIPLSIFDLTDLNQLKMAVNYTNLQPLEGKENQRKGNRIF